MKRICCLLLLSFSLLGLSLSSFAGQVSVFVSGSRPIVDTVNFGGISSADYKPAMFAPIEKKSGPDVLPKFQGGWLNEFRQWVNINTIPQFDSLGNRLCGVTKVRFKIDREGEVSDVEVLETVDSLLGNEVARVVAKSPAWEPACNNDKPVEMILIISVNIYSDNGVVAMSKNEEGIYFKLDAESEPVVVAPVAPSFRGGTLVDFRKWVISQFQCPDSIAQVGLNGRAVVQFVVEPNGSLSSFNPAVSPDEGVSCRLISIMRSSPQWTAGLSEDGTPIRTLCTLPFQFNINPNPSKLFDTPASFRGGGTDKFYKWTAEQLKGMRIGEYRQGTTVVSFVVDVDGRLTDITVYDMPDLTTCQSLIYLYEHAPLWTPAMLDGKPVKSQLRISYRFR